MRSPHAEGIVIYDLKPFMQSGGVCLTLTTLARALRSKIFRFSLNSKKDRCQGAVFGRSGFGTPGISECSSLVG
jgi:hypothetical protein